MKILAIGDVTSTGGVKHLEDRLWGVRSKYGIDLCIVNAENAGFITGPSPEIYDRLLCAGADCLTGGNHTLRNRASYSYLDDKDTVLRPINFGADAPGQGYTLLDCSGIRVLVISAMGNVHIEPVLDSPFEPIDRVLAREAGRYDFAIVDIHAEATGEKLALGYYLDGRASVVFGTHTHVPTADGRILPRGTGYISDLGMCGESGGVLGMDAEGVIKRMKTHLPLPFRAASGSAVADGVIFTVDEKTKKCLRIERISF